MTTSLPYAYMRWVCSECGGEPVEVSHTSGVDLVCETCGHMFAITGPSHAEHVPDPEDDYGQDMDPLELPPGTRLTEGGFIYRQAPHPYCGSNSDRQSVGDPGHCEDCCAVGHLIAHPDFGCADVGCYSDHGNNCPLCPARLSEHTGRGQCPRPA